MYSDRILFFCLIVFICVPFTATAKIQRDTTLSPYFFIEGAEKSHDDFPLKDTKVEVVISGVIANVTVRQYYANNGSHPINAKYIFPGSTNAAVHGMTMTIGERRITAQIHKKEKAKQIFEQAKAAGKNSSLLSQQRPNVFSMDVANIMPGDTVEIELRYSELLVPSESIYSFVFPTVVGPRYSDQPATNARPEDQWIANPYLKKGAQPHTGFSLSARVAAGMPIHDVQCRTHKTRTTYIDEKNVDVQLDPAASFGGDRDFILKYRLQGKQITSGLLLQKGEKENYFLLMAQPPQRVLPEAIPPREYLFVVDVSGSMHGFPLHTAKTLIKDLVMGLRPTDHFNLLLFAGSSAVMAPASLPANQENIDQALHFVNNQQGGGGTNLLSAMNEALSLPKREGVSRTIVVLTDGYIDAEKEVFHTIQENLQHSNLFAFGIGSSVNRYLIEGMAKSGQGEPFIVTDPDMAPATAQHFRDYISAPVLTNIQVTANNFTMYDVEPQKFPDLFAQRPVLVFGKWRGEPNGVLEISGAGGNGPFHQSYQVTEATIVQDRGLEYLWARTRISRLSDFAQNNINPEHVAEVTTLGLTHNLLTAFTSFVAVDERIRNPHTQAEDVTQPLPLPKGVSNASIGNGSMHRVPEPELIFLLPFIGLVLAFRYRKHRKAQS
ncbi:VIT and vWA domain-containing protein [Desulfogranum japonicum]|uniref:VIT and vWA domain-containing protein n=1 Tax=Desulfogranum japonicum TaxID=231447 RepID=UPI00040B3D6C|nr:VIT and VWA domain-containing protein [Desulfogranum japonicum]